MEENTQLPKEVVNEIKTNAAIRCDRDNGKDDNSFRNGYYSGYVSGATAYATKLHQANETIKELERQNEKLKATATGWRPLLESVLREDKTFGTISNPTIDKIKKFLYGE